MTLTKQGIDVSFAEGLDTKTDPKQVVAADSNTVKVTVGPKPASSVHVISLKAKGHGQFSLHGGARPLGETGAKVELLVLDTASGAPTRFRVLDSVKFGPRSNKFTFGAMKLKRGTRWVLQLEYIRPGEAPSFSALRTVNVH